MPWIFDLFLVTLCALTTCHVVSSKQGITIRALGYNRCVTRRRDLDRVQRIAVERGICSRSEASLTSLQEGASVGTPRLLEEDIGRSPLSLSLSICLSHIPETSTLLRIKCERYIFIKKCSFVH